MQLLRVSMVALVLGSSGASAQPKASHPRVGQMTELAFQRGSDMLPIGVERVVGVLAAWAKDNPEGFVVVEGHTDAEGDAKRNLALSVRRADSVVKQLLALGIWRDQIVIGGFGESRRGRGVVMWSSRSEITTIEAQLRERGAKTVQTSVLVARR